MTAALAVRRCAAPAEDGNSQAAADRMEKKLAQIKEKGAGRNGLANPILLSEDEVNSYFEYRMGARIPRGVSQVRFRLHQDRVAGSALVDFEEVKAASRRPLNPLVDQLLSGKRPVTALGRFTSEKGTGMFHLEEVSLGSLALRGLLLDLVVRHFVLPRYPRAAIDQPFRLPENIEQIVLEEGRALVRFPRR